MRQTSSFAERPRNLRRAFGTAPEEWPDQKLLAQLYGDRGLLAFNCNVQEHLNIAPSIPCVEIVLFGSSSSIFTVIVAPGSDAVPSRLQRVG